MSIHEECGVFGIFSPKSTSVAAMTYYGLYALQHRGQESCGITVGDNGVFFSHKDLGLVNDVFSREVLARFPNGTMSIGHVRYGTASATNRRNCQPLAINHQKGKMALANNGSLSNADVLRDRLELTGAIFHTTIDSEIIAYLITQARLTTPSIEDAISQAMNSLEGAYSLCLMSNTKLVAVRDPQGFRPLCYGKMPDSTFVIASESCALNAVGASFERDLLPGEILVFTKDGIISRLEHCNKKPRKSCVFEYIYFARPDSIIDGVSIHQARTRAGEILAACHPVDADVVIGVPDSGLDAALGYSHASNIPYGIGLIKNKYIGRTFIVPGQENRVDRVRIKLNPIAKTVYGKKVVLIDDSIVRGTTSKRITDLIRKAGAKEIHLRISAPPFLHPCYYGTDIDSTENLVAAKHTLEEIAQIVGADTLGYLPIASLPALSGGISCCDACFSGRYPTNVPEKNKENTDKHMPHFS